MRAASRVITELVINHTSDQHPWFQRAGRPSPDSVGAQFLRLVATPTERYADTRIIFIDTEKSNWTWDPVAKRLLLASILLPTSPTSILTIPDVLQGSAWRDAILAATWGSTGFGSTPFPI